jgi:hypothetical protein
MGEFVLGKYRLLVELARGGMGIVYLAIAKGPGGFSKLLIIKELKPELVNDAAFLSMFLEEARLAARLEHPNIVQTIEVGEADNRHYIAMEYLQGQPLSRIRKRQPKGFTLAVELRIVSEILRGLHHAHTLEDFDGAKALVIHRDVSPQNVFLTYDGQAKIVDFGIAKAADTEHHTQAGMFKGKAAYIAPEQVTGHALDPRTDVFASGIMLWEAIAGRRMWTHRNDIDILKRLLANDIPDLRAARPDVDGDLLPIVQRAMAWKVEDRYPSAEALAVDLDAYLASHGGAPNMREIGALLESAFAVEREELRRVVEPQLAALRRKAPAARVPNLPRLPAVDGPITGPLPETPRGSGMMATDLPVPAETARGATKKSPTKSRPLLALALAVFPIAIAAGVFIGIGAGGDPRGAGGHATIASPGPSGLPAESAGPDPRAQPAQPASTAPPSARSPASSPSASSPTPSPAAEGSPAAPIPSGAEAPPSPVPGAHPSEGTLRAHPSPLSADRSGTSPGLPPFADPASSLPAQAPASPFQPSADGASGGVAAEPFPPALSADDP